MYGTNCNPEEWAAYCNMQQVYKGEALGEWKDRIWPCLQYFTIAKNFRSKSGGKILV